MEPVIKRPRFSIEKTEDDLKRLLDMKESKNTKKATKSAVNIFRSYCIERLSSQTEKFYFAHKRSFSPENFAQKCRKLLQIIMSLIRWSGFSLVDDPQTQ